MFVVNFLVNYLGLYRHVDRNKKSDTYIKICNFSENFLILLEHFN